MKRILIFFCALALAATVSAQMTQASGYFHIANQGDTILTAPASWTGQAGGGSPTATTWSSTFAVTPASLPFLVQWSPPSTGSVWTNPIMGADPYPNSSKEIGAIQMPVAQTFTVQPEGSSTAVTVIVPPLIVTPPPTPPLPTQQGIQYTCSAPAPGTIIPASLPQNGLAIICVVSLANLPVPAS